MSMKEWKSLVKNKALIAIIGLKIIGIGNEHKCALFSFGIGVVVGMAIMNIVRKFQKGENNA